MSLQVTLDRLLALRAEVCAVVDAAVSELQAHAGDLHACPLPRVRVIQETVAEWYDMPQAVMRAQSKMREHVLPRHVAMYLARQLTKHGTEQIGRCFERDHGTVLHAVRAMQNRIDTDGAFAADLRSIRAQAEERLGGLDMPLFRRAVG